MKADRQAGFTLIELLVSMTLLGLLFVLLFGGLRFGMRAWDRSTVNAANSDSVRTVQQLLRNTLEQACPRRIFEASGAQRVLFSGSPRSVQFLGPAPEGNGCARLDLAVASSNAGQNLVFSVNQVRTDLLLRAQSIAFGYLGPQGWQSDWRGRADLPALIRLRVAFPKDDGREWPELFIAPRISAEADCTYDPSTKSCRGS